MVRSPPIESPNMSLALPASASLQRTTALTAGVMPRFLALAAVVAGIDLLSKAVATGALSNARVLSLSERIGFMLVYNTGTAGGLSIGPYTWAVNVLVTLGAIAMVLRIVQALADVDPRSTLPLALVTGGAAGNLASMMVGPQGVADFIAVQITQSSTMILNVADLFLWSGALLLVPVVVRLVNAVRAEQRNRGFARITA